MSISRLSLAAIAALTVLAFAASDASAQYLPNSAFAPGYGAHYRTYPTQRGGIVNQTQYTTPYGTTYSRQYVNPYTGITSVQSSNYVPFGNYNTPFISPALMPYYGGPTYGGSYVYPLYDNFGNRIRFR